MQYQYHITQHIISYLIIYYIIDITNSLITAAQSGFYMLLQWTPKGFGFSWGLIHRWRVPRR